MTADVLRKLCIMGRFATTEVPAWRIWLWGFVGALAVCVLSLYSSGHFDPLALIPAAFVGLLFPGFGFFLLRSSRSGFAVRHMRKLFVIYIAGQTLLLVLAIVFRQR